VCGDKKTRAGRLEVVLARLSSARPEPHMLPCRPRGILHGMTNSDDTLNHRALGIELFNKTWELMGKQDRSVEEDDAMLHMAHASAHHWRAEGTGATAHNLARSEWQVSRVYTVLGRGEPAEYHARRCLEICQANGIGDWDVAYAYEALARAASVTGDLAEANFWVEQARRAAAVIAEDEDRDAVLADLATIPGLSAGNAS